MSRRRLAGNSLLVYVDAQPGDGHGITLWFEPTWHLRGPDRILTGSRQAMHNADAEDPDAGFNLAAEAVDVLNGRRIADLTIESGTGDLFLWLDGEYLVRTFVSDPMDDEIWHIRDNASGVRLTRSGRQMAIPAADCGVKNITD